MSYRIILLHNITVIHHIILYHIVEMKVIFVVVKQLSLFITGIGIPVRLMWGIRGWCGRGGSGKRCDGACVCEREGMNSVVNTVIVWIGNVDGLWVELLKANGGKGAVVASVRGYKVDTCGVRGREENPRARVSEIAKPIHI